MTATLTPEEADAFVSEWLDAWNAHDVDRIASHYHADVEYHSPFVARLAGDRSHLSGLPAVRGYIASALARFPDLELGPLLAVAPGAGSIAIVYRSIEGLLAVETLVLDDEGSVVRAHCHYRADGVSRGSSR